MVNNNKLTLIKELNIHDKNGNKVGLFMCSCKEKTICEKVIDKVLTNRIKSCGCLSRRRNKTRSDEYRAWESMKRRCYNKKDQRYNRYGLIGIKVCDRWINSFENFLDDMGNKPSKKHSLERKNVYKDYSPDNCVWATEIDQQNNRTNNRRLEFGGESFTLSQWSRKLNISVQTLWYRLSSGWSIEDALTKPKRYKP